MEKKLPEKECITILYWGKKRGGKTYNAAKEIQKMIARGHDVWTNIPIQAMNIPKNSPGKIYESNDPEDLLYMRNGLWVFDEAYLKLNSRKWSDLPDSVHECIAQGGKMRMRHIIIAQGWKRIDLVIRETADEIYRFEKILFGKAYRVYHGQVDPLTGNLIENWVSWPKFFRRKVFEFYDTDQLYGSILKKLPEKKFSEIAPPTV